MNLPRLHVLGSLIALAFLLQGSLWSTAVASTPSAVARSSAYDAGMAAMRARKYAQAEKQFRLAIAHKERLPESYAGLGYAASSLHDYSTAFSAFKKAAALAPRTSEYLYQAAYAALYAADLHACVRYATLYLKQNPRSWQGYHLRFLAYGNLLLHKQQVQDATMVVRLRPRDSGSYNDLGIALANDKQYSRGIAAFGKAIKLAPRNPLYYMNRGLAENFARRLTAALRDFKKARSLTHDPTLSKQLDDYIRYLEKRLHS